MFSDKQTICEFFADGDRIDHGLAEKFAVFEKQGYRWLQFDKIYFQAALELQCPSVPVFPYVQAMLMSVAMRSAPVKSVLNLGTGGAAIERFITEYIPAAGIDSVEYSEDVIAIARQYFALPDSVTVSCTDAFAYIAAHKRQHDLVLVDLFAEDFYHTRLLNVDMWQHLSRCTAPDGTLVLNIVVDEMDTLARIVNFIQEYFSHVAIFHMEDFHNVVVYCQRQSFVSLHALKETAADLQSVWKLSFDELLKYMVYLPETHKNKA